MRPHPPTHCRYLRAQLLKELMESSGDNPSQGVLFPGKCPLRTALTFHGICLACPRLTIASV